jgi:hypothetical protein
VGKLLGFDFAVEYKLGTTNTVADALSRHDTTEDGTLFALSAPHFNFLARLRQLHDTDPAMVALREEITTGGRSAPWTLVDGMVQFTGRLYIPLASQMDLVRACVICQRYKSEHLHPAGLLLPMPVP